MPRLRSAQAFAGEPQGADRSFNCARLNIAGFIRSGAGVRPAGGCGENGHDREGMRDPSVVGMTNLGTTNGASDSQARLRILEPAWRVPLHLPILRLMRLVHFNPDGTTTPN
jgi:hypothetical protein